MKQPNTSIMSADDFWASFTRGEMKSTAPGGDWAYDNGKFSAVSGSWHQCEWKWTGGKLEPVNDGAGVARAEFTSGELRIFFTPCSWITEPFITLRAAGDGRWTTEKVAYGVPVVFTVDRTARTWQCDTELEGVASKGDALGEIPPPLVVFAAVLPRLQRSCDKWNAERNRTLSRCGKVVMAPKANMPPLFCPSCTAAARCVVCPNELTFGGEPSTGVLCKTCVRFRMKCARCGAPAKSGGVDNPPPAQLCGDCSLGPKGKCCRMIE